MVDRLIPGRARIAAAVLAALGLTWSLRGHALEDPTRPPAGLGRSGPAKSTPADLVLQSVIISELGRAAIINGERVVLGAKVGAGRLVKVSESEVELLIGDERRTLALFPGVDMRRAIPRGDGGER